MDRVPPKIARLDLPSLPGRNALRAGLMAMNVLPAVMPVERDGGRALERAIQTQPWAVFFIDISNDGKSDLPTLLQLDAALSPHLPRDRIVLTRLSCGHVSQADRHWVRSLGFADLLPELDAHDPEGGLRSALDVTAKLLGMTPLAPDELVRHVRAITVDRASETPRAVIRKLTGKSAEDLAALLHRSLEVADRTYRLKRYLRCFIGTEAVAWMSRHFSLSRAAAVALGHSLVKLGLLVHVAHDQPFKDEHLFYRLALADAVDRLPLGELVSVLSGHGGVPVADRSYLGTTYPACWIGAEAVEHLCRHHGLDRHEAWLILHRLMQFGLIEHVTRDRPLIDGNFFYRFVGLPLSQENDRCIATLSANS